MRDRVRGGEWELLDSWWSIFARRTSPNGNTTRNRILNPARQPRVWSELDGWWDIFTETGHETALEIRDLLLGSNERWASGQGPFDTDPLATDVAAERSLLGPLQPVDELQWSYWLAELLRVPRFTEQIFGCGFSDEDIEVIREDSYKRESEDGTRRADIVLRQGDIGVSIEVKLFDTRFAKTAETAALVEGANSNLEWSHSLLLPNSQRKALVDDVDVSLETTEDGTECLESHEPVQINIVYWRDIATEARRLLRDGLIENDQWNAAAYLFCGLVEQQLLNFQPLPVIQRMADAERVTDTTRPIQLGTTLDEQLTHLQSTVDT